MGRSYAIKNRLKNSIGWWLGAISAAVAALWAPFQKPIFDVPYASVVYTTGHQLTGARIAADGQWRFPESKSLPKTYLQAVLTFEDKNFYRHPGIDPLAIGRAAWVNLKNGGIRQGGSTITMQVARLSMLNQPRTWLQKLKELVLAFRLEIHFSKEEILRLYASHAPMGGNVVGIDAAAWRYFNRAPQDLSLAEYALLAVLPNAPSALHPGKNRDELIQKRNRLIQNLHKKDLITQIDAELAILETLPDKPYPLPDFTPHITQWALINQPGEQIFITIDLDLQQHAAQILDKHHTKLSGNGVHNAAMLVCEVKTGKVLVYHGNTLAGKAHGEFVDVVRAPRSSGSILKPFLYGAMLQNAELMPDELVVDIPTFLAGFNPMNYNRDYSGAVPASDALARSLNVPAVRQLRQFGVQRFKNELQRLGFSTLIRSAKNYGLSLILGGAEVTLWDISSAYNTLAQSVQLANFTIPAYPMHVLADDTLDERRTFHPGAAYLTLQAMRKTGRTTEQEGWQYYSNKTVAWKTGTSFGFRDAWAVGVNAEYVVAVWVGNADGEGRPGVIGAEAAAPIMFEMFSSLPGKSTWFAPPYDHMEEVITCKESGLLASVHCPHTKNIQACQTLEPRPVCGYHKLIWLTTNEKYSLSGSCQNQGHAFQKPWFVLPPAIEHYYKKKNASYLSVPPLNPSCTPTNEDAPMQFIYPSNFQYLMAAKQLNGNEGVIIFKLAHRFEKKSVYWHAGDLYLGSTRDKHEIAVNINPGSYILKAVDEDGFEIFQKFEVL